ncbi:MAG: single-stranded DNA-binding protein [Candidatus Hydrogenedentota bacterium]
MADLRMPDLNKVQLAGRLTRDPELKYIASGTALCKLGMAVSRKYKTKTGDMKEETLFMNVTVWGQAAEWIGDKMKKGQPVLVEGRLTSNEWEDKNGQKRTTIEVNADRVQSLAWDDRGDQGNQGGGGGGSSYSEAPKPRPIEEPIPEDDIPF